MLKLVIFAFLLSVLPFTANAQFMDYSSLESMFGEPVTLSATGKPQRISDVPASMEIITAADIRRSAMTDIPDILHRFAGIDVYRSSFNGVDVSIRGYDAPMTGRTLVLIDGRQVYNDSFGFVSWNQLPVEIDEIRQIEVIKGPLSALYGFNAASGVINILTYSPLDTSINSVRMTVGNQQTLGGSAIVSGKSGNVAVRLSASDTVSSGNSNQYSWFGQDQSGMDPKHRSFHGVVEVKFDDGSRLRIGGSKVDGRELRLNSGFITDLWQNNYAIKGEYTRSTDYGVLTFRAYHNQFNTQVAIPDLITSSLRNSATVVSVQDLFKLGDNDSFRISTEFRQDKSTVLGNSAGSLYYNVFSASLMENHEFNESWSLNNAVRFDSLHLGRIGPISKESGLSNSDFNRVINAISYNSGLVWKYDDYNTFRLTAARGLNLPSLFNLGSYEGNTFTDRPDGKFRYALEYGSPDVNPVVVNNYELSWDSTISAINAKTKTSVFYQTNTGLVAFAPSFVVNNNNIALLPFVNYGNSSTLGVELGITGKIASNWTWGLNYSLQTIWDNYTLTSRFPLEGNSGRSPNSKVNARIAYTADSWDFDLDVHYVGMYKMPDMTQDITSPTRGSRKMGDYVTFEPRIAYHVTPIWTVQVSGQGPWAHWETPIGKTGPFAMLTVIGRW